ncbi:metallophosphoesterase family protein [Candidatus Dependentiae bacterium]|nr:metallophosphoesterase family protein [Candidatus Dependentiae bacterium]
MRYCFISDIHSNLPALESVIHHSKKYQIDKYICLGDIVGYNSNPGECIELIKTLTDEVCAGNHDYAVAGKLETDEFNKFAKFAVDWTKQNITSCQIEYLTNNLKIIVSAPKFEAVHGALSNPVTDYMMNIWIAVTNFKLMKTNLCFIGHTHIPIIFYQNIDGKEPGSIKIIPFEKYKIDNNKKYIINVGSIGQPRDNDPRASYLIFDDEEMSLTYNRVDYNIEFIQSGMKKFGFPEYLITRLSSGQ